MTAKLTLTEALAELKTLDKRIATKMNNILQYAARRDQIKDPLEKEGGSPKFVKEEKQAMNDLETRKITIRRAIARANESTPVSITLSTGKVYNKSLAEWLTWRKEVVPNKQKFAAAIRAKLNEVKREAQSLGGTVVAPGEASKPVDVVVNFPEKELATEAEEIEEILGVLDGQLSLRNATVTIEV